ncbi:hypothetical protein BDM02DRAFT_3193385 [Thelephora ganbajun]|uniref:Uncharacterized protein n=1 Tax=Thelephora ganbajun TaxID=370292 RepID=A0ACB6YYN7_THEGA|nr:hypothetical protein BDM02DRAFT_3193385 [Thelephora ganbajun]
MTGTQSHWYFPCFPAALYSDSIWVTAMALFKSNIEHGAAALMGSNLTLTDLLTIGLVDWEGANFESGRPLDSIRFATTVAERLLTQLEVTAHANALQLQASGLDTSLNARNSALEREVEELKDKVNQLDGEFGVLLACVEALEWVTPSEYLSVEDLLRTGGGGEASSSSSIQTLISPQLLIQLPPSPPTNTNYHPPLSSCSTWESNHLPEVVVKTLSGPKWEDDNGMFEETSSTDRYSEGVTLSFDTNYLLTTPTFQLQQPPLTLHSHPPLSSRSMRDMNQILEVFVQTLHSPKWKEEQRMFKEAVIEEYVGISQPSLPGRHSQEATLVKWGVEEDNQDAMMGHKGPLNIGGELEIKMANVGHDERVGGINAN